MSATVLSRDRLLIDGEWVAPAGTGVIEVVNPTTEEALGSVPAGSAADVDRAVGAAATAFEAWAATPVEERREVLRLMQQGLTARAAEIADLVTAEVGMPYRLSMLVQAGLPTLVTGSYVEILADFPFEEQVANSLVVREPIGVVACVTPWNYPLHQLVLKVAPALAAGCTVVAKPAEVAPLTAFLLADVLVEAGLPPGVFNLVSGHGTEAGEALVSHPGVDMVSFTGSTAAGRRVAAAAAATVKRVSTELGGKSPLVMLDDADLEEAVRAGVTGCYLNSGQTCIASSRLLVPRARCDDAVELARSLTEAYVVGDPFDPRTDMGPLVSSAHRERVRSHVARARADGARLVTGGTQAPPGLDRGWFVSPTVLADVHSGMAVAQEEVFGPVLAVIPHDGDDDAVRIANDTVYGLHAGVHSGDRVRATAVARRIRAGQIDVNGGSFNVLAPWSGYKQSGNGREFGRYGLEEYLTTKSLQL